MLKVISRQILVLILSFLGITLLFFTLTQLTPDDSNVVWQGHVRSADSALAQKAIELGVDDSYVYQYINYLRNILSGDFGLSITSNRPVLSEFLNFIPATLELGFFATLIALILGIPAGVAAATNKNTWVDSLIMTVTLIGYSIPVFWWGMLLIFVFSLFLDITPVAGRISFIFDIDKVTGFMLVDSLLAYPKYQLAAFFDALKHLILPSIVLATLPLAVIARMTRSAMLEVLASEYILTAKAKGLSRFRIIWVHGLRNALIPIITVIGLQSSILLTGAVLTETIFAWPGIGKWMVEAIYRQDYPSIQGGILLISSIVILINISIDLLYAFINPRLRKPV
ncbi:ABC transporter permease [Pleionea sp. CnH1-48]|uniref:ABC transporter permease n=1 Tax=Pleionea sp. CnH1-48 TaxID=2954494 RepID=UPI002097B01A|nr:ABC transporter permease subunit [Pleionea sp. CnH1-48]MCO7225449.1 ABC transporter permease subunit [Pleionea sp. CnH1-48]